MISFSQAEQVHNIVIEIFGGSLGIRDQGAPESSLARPFQTFEGRELYGFGLPQCGLWNMD